MELAWMIQIGPKTTINSLAFNSEGSIIVVAMGTPIICFIRAIDALMLNSYEFSQVNPSSGNSLYNFLLLSSGSDPQAYLATYNISQSSLAGS